MPIDVVTDETRRARIGVIITVTTALTLLIVAMISLDGSDWKAWALLGVLVVTGVGLVLGIKLARVPGGLLLLAAAVFAIYALVQLLTASSFEGPVLDWLVPVANAVGTTTLFVWLCVRGIQAMLGSSRGPSLVTARLTGGVLAIVAAHHLWIAMRVGDGWQGMWSLSFSSSGTFLLGFLGWPIWHGALGVIAVALLVAPAQLLRHVAAALAVLFVIPVPLALFAVNAGMLDVAMVVILAELTLLPAALALWLRDELRAFA